MSSQAAARRPPPRRMEHAHLVELVERSSTPWERLTGSFEPAGSAPEEVEERLEAWRKILGGDERRLRVRLSWDGLDADAARRALSPVRLAEGEPLPAWAELLAEAVDRALASEPGSAVGERFLDPDQPVAFEEILSPFVLYAREHLESRATASPELITEPALGTFERSLLGSLAGLCREVLLHELDRVRGREQTGLARLLAAAFEPEGRRLYDSFVETFLDGELVDFLLRYPVLGRRLAVTVEQWVDATGELLERLAADRPDLDRTFGDGGELGPVVAVSTAMSDPHRNGRTVSTLAFSSGRRLVYKPKDMGAEEGYHHLLAWLDERGAPLPLRVLRVLNRGTHGWVDHVAHDPCTGEGAPRRYYERAGMLLCLVYALEGTDCHYENILASGEHPVLVDAETLLHHRVRAELPGSGSEAQVLANEALEHSVLRTGLLPRWELGDEENTAFDVSGLGSVGEQEVPIQAPEWEHVNTDRMAIRLRPGRLARRKNNPFRDDEPLSLDDHADDVVRGFESMYRFLVARRDELLAPDGPIERLARHPVRFVFRPTRSYALVQMTALGRRCLTDGAERGIELDRLAARAMPPVDPDEMTRPSFWPLLALEREAMERGDVPFFTARAESDGLTPAPGVELEGCFVEPSHERVLQRLRSLSESDCERQVALIQGTFYAHVARSTPAVDDVAEAGVQASGGEAEIGAGEAVERARQIAEEIARRALRAEDGGAAWIAPQYLVRTDRYQLQPVDYSLYGGTCGIALFLAALERVSGGSGRRELALGALQPLRWALRSQGDRLAGMMGPGGGSGLGSFVYCLARVGRLLDEPELFDDARRAAELAVDELVVSDRAYDVVSGTAGLLLGCLVLYGERPEPTVLERAVVCGRHLLARRQPSPSGHRSWITADGRFTTGMSHGAAGIAYALLRLHALTGDTELVEAAREAIAYEDSVFSPETGNWADFRDQDDPLYVWSWCHGAPGIGIARVACLEHLDDERMREDVERALRTTRAFGLRLIDHLCCGNMGRVEVMLTAGHRLGRGALIDAAHRLARQAVDRADAMGAYMLHPMLPKRVHNPSFFQGTAGIGYQLLRLAHPDELPSVLVWE